MYAAIFISCFSLMGVNALSIQKRSCSVSIDSDFAVNKVRNVNFSYILLGVRICCSYHCRIRAEYVVSTLQKNIPVKYHYRCGFFFFDVYVWIECKVKDLQNLAWNKKPLIKVYFINLTKISETFLVTYELVCKFICNSSDRDIGTTSSKFKYWLGANQSIDRFFFYINNR